MNWKMKSEENWGQLGMKYDTYLLRDLAEIKYGKNQKKVADDNGIIPIYGTGGLMGYANQALCSKPSVLIGRKGTIDRVKYVDHPFWTVDTLFYTIVNEEIVIPKYLYYAMSLLDMNQYNEGTTIPSLRTETLYRLEFKIPTRKDQEEILSILKPIENRIINNDAINKNLLQQAGAVFKKYYDESPNQQPFTSLIDVLGGGTPKTGNPDFWDGPIPFFTPKDVGAPYTFQTEKYITESGLAHCNSRLYQKGTTFVTARGTVGKVSLAGTPMAMNQSCYALASETADPLLVYFYALKAVASLKHKASGAVFDAIVTRDFDSETINILSDDDSKSVLSIIRPMMDAIHNNSEENMRLAALRDSLLPRLMSGELDVSDLDL